MSKLSDTLKSGRNRSNADSDSLYVGKRISKDTACKLAVKLCGYTEQECAVLMSGNGGTALFVAILDKCEDFVDAQ